MKIQIEHIEKSGFCSSDCEGRRHIKTLPYLSIVQSVEGSYEIQIADRQSEETGTSGFFLAPADLQQTITHHIDQARGQMICRWVFLKVRLNDLYHYDDLFEYPTILPDAQKKEMNDLFERLFSGSDPFDETACCYEILRLLFQISCPKKRAASSHLEGALSYMKKNYSQKISIRQIADAVNLSPSHLYAVFKKEFAVSPIAYLNNYRLSMAAELLLKTDRRITEIADAVGIADSVYFNKMFRKAYQMSPSQYRVIYAE